ncbi:MAG: hypothetical protein FWC40_09515, partial [Proteobacteria bacterium]|nr:hypothetical protein [Pseudomonadota bacterium]
LPPLRGLNRRPRNAPLFGFFVGERVPPHPLRYVVSPVGRASKGIVAATISIVANRGLRGWRGTSGWFV